MAYVFCLDTILLLLEKAIESRATPWGARSDKLKTVFPNENYKQLSDYFIQKIIQSGIIEKLLNMLTKRYSVMSGTEKIIFHPNSGIIVKICLYLQRFIEEFKKLDPANKIPEKDNNYEMRLKDKIVSYLKELSEKDAQKGSVLEVNDIFQILVNLNQIEIKNSKIIDLEEMESIRAKMLNKFVKSKNKTDRQINEVAILLQRYSARSFTEQEKSQTIKAITDSGIIRELFKTSNLPIISKTPEFLDFITQSINKDSILSILNSLDFKNIKNENYHPQKVIDSISKGTTQNVIEQLVDHYLQRPGEAKLSTIMFFHSVLVYNHKFNSSLKDMPRGSVVDDNNSNNVKKKMLELFNKVLITDRENNPDKKNYTVQAIRLIVEDNEFDKVYALLVQRDFELYIKKGGKPIELAIVLEILLKKNKKLKKHLQIKDFDHKGIFHRMVDNLDRNKVEMAKHQEVVIRSYFFLFDQVLYQIKFNEKKIALNGFLEQYLKSTVKVINNECRHFIGYTKHVDSKTFFKKRRADEEREYGEEQMKEEIENYLLTNEIATVPNEFFPYVFEINKSYKSLKNTADLWHLLLKAKTSEAFDKLTQFIQILYISFPVDSKKIKITNMFKDFNLHFINTIKEMIDKGKHNKINRLLGFFLHFFKSVCDVRLVREETNINHSIRFRYSSKRVHISTYNANFTLYDLLSLKFKHQRNKLIVKDDEDLQLNYFSLYMRMTATELNTINKSGIVIGLMNTKKFFDEDHYRKTFKQLLSDSMSFVLLIHQLLEINDNIFTFNLRAILNLIPIHKNDFKYFKNEFTSKEIDIYSIFKFNQDDMFDRYLESLRSIVKQENGKKKRNICLILRRNHLNEFFDLFELIADREKVDNKITLLDIIFNVMLFDCSDIRIEYDLSKITPILMKLLQDTVSDKMIDQKNGLRIIFKMIFIMYVQKQISLKKMIYDISYVQKQKKESEMQLIRCFIDIINEIPEKEMLTNDINEVVQDKKVYEDNNNKLIVLALILKNWKRKDLSIRQEKEATSILFKLLLLRDNHIKGDFLIQMIKLMTVLFKKIRRIEDMINGHLFNWLDYFVFRTNKQQDNYDNYQYLIANDQVVFDFYQFLIVLIKKTPSVLKLMRTFSEFIQYQKERGSQMKSWRIAVNLYQVGKSNKFRGLRNLSSTCYINSCIQQLFMIEEFVNFVIRIEDNNELSVFYNVS